MKDWKKVQGSMVERPAEFDTESSPTTVYQRRNIKQITVEAADGSTSTMWEYEERTMSHTEYICLISETNKSQIEYIAVMADIELDGGI